MNVMGIALWLTSALVALGVARIIPPLRPPQWWPELVATLLTALAAGFGATALDFGGWNQLDWRAAAFAFLCAFAAAALVRLAVTSWRRSAAPPPPESARRPARADR
jgi:hypothetical protein